ncbi:MAG TPA: glycerophosphodiester phosphodiesterase [Spirochaetaceae bacterium]|nr:glycerophosphodiester phosphodiesterase [Spirochaetaceae bacterium]
MPLLPDFPRPLVFAHRGLSASVPENTMASFAAARKAGIPGIELDVHLTKDGKLIVFHDDTTGRIGTGPAGALSIEGSDSTALSALDIGSWKDPAYSGERMPLLEAVLEEFGPTQYFDIEIKSRTVADAGLERLLAAAVADHHMEGRCLVSSFNPFALRRFKAFSPGVPTAIIWSRSTELYWFLRRGEGRWIGNVDVLKPEQGLLKRKRLFSSLRPPVLPWTVDTRADAERLLAFGAAGIISNRPEDIGIQQAL